MRPVLCERFSGTIDFGEETNYREATSVPLDETALAVLVLVVGAAC